MAGKNTEVKIIAPKQIFPEIRNMVNSSVTFAQGDILIFDGTVVRAPSAESEAAKLVGVAQQDITAGVILSPYQGTAVDAAQGSIALNGPVYGNTYNFTIKTGDSLAIGDNVYAYVAGGKSYVASSAGIGPGTKPIGVYVGQTAVSSAAAGTQVECLIGARFPNDTLKF